VLVDLPAEVGRTRRAGVHDRLESESADFHGAVRALFLELAGAEPDRYLVVDGELPPGQIGRLVQDRVGLLPAVLGVVR